jgi:hypothetical protein
VAEAIRWCAAIAVALLLLGLLAYARGPEHRRGDDVGSHGTKVIIVRTEDK